MVRGLLREAVYLSYHMQGGVTYEMVLDMSPIEREIVAEFVGEQIEYQQSLLKVGIRP